MESAIQNILSKVELVLDDVIKLGPVTFRLVSNSASFTATDFFSKSIRRRRTELSDFSFELWCISLPAQDYQSLAAFADRSYRAQSFLDGYYVTDHFGDPIILVSRGNCLYVFGNKLETVVWPYFAKYFLLLHSVRHESLFLKGASFAIGDTGTLLLGRGGAGKTVFLTELCQHGAKFISNSHLIIKNQKAMGIASSIRVRPGQWYSELISTAARKHSLREEEFIIDPCDVFSIQNEVMVKNICIVDFRQVGAHVVKQLTTQQAYAYAEQFSLGMNVYRLEEDLLDYYDGNVDLFSEQYIKMRESLHMLVSACNTYYISSDVKNESNRCAIQNMLC